MSFTISNIIQFIMLCILTLDTIERRYPEQFRDFMVSGSMNLIYAYSKLQILYFKGCKIAHAFIERHPELKRMALKRTTSASIVPFFAMKSDGSTLRFVVQTLIRPNGETLTCVCFDNEAPHFEETDFKFILLECTLGSATYKFNLKTDAYNYYVVGNRFNKEFFYYFAERHHGLSLDNDASCSVRLIDHEIETKNIYFTEKDESIVLDKSCYRILIE